MTAHRSRTVARRRGARSNLRALLPLALLVMAALPAAGHRDAFAVAPTGVTSASSLARLPLAARAAVSGALGRDALAYRAAGSGRRVTLTNGAQHLSVGFGFRGVEFRSGTTRFALSLHRIGYGSRLARVPPAVPHAWANRVSYRRGRLGEWYVNGPLGVEQGFTVRAQPASVRRGPLTLALGLSGNRRASLLPARDGLRFAGSSLRYRGLFASDARGKRLRSWLELRGRTLLLRVADAGARYPVRIDPFVQQAKLTPSDGAAGDDFAVSVAIDGNTIVAGSPDALVTPPYPQGAVYVFVKPPGGWANATQTAKLAASGGTENRGEKLGSSVAVSADTVAAGAPHATNANAEGAVYVFVKPAGGWADGTEAAKLAASDAASGDSLGTSVAVSGGTVVAGAPYDNIAGVESVGSAYVFVKPPTAWANATETAKLTAPGGPSSDQMGYSVAVSGDTVVAGARVADRDPGTPPGQPRGAAYVFVKPAGGWTSAAPAAKLTASDAAAGDYLGSSVAILGDTVVVGAPDAHRGTFLPGPGIAYVFLKPAGGWVDGTEAAMLTASDRVDADQFGASVAVSADTIAVGAIGVRAPDYNGAAYVFTEPASGGWANATETAKLTASDGQQFDALGSSVSVSGGTIAVGMRGNQGLDGAYVFGVNPSAVRLLFFAARGLRGGVALRWRVASELGTLGYDVYREQGGRRVRLNRALLAAGNGYEARTYRFLDRSAREAGGARYRLELVGVDGTRRWLATAAA